MFFFCSKAPKLIRFWSKLAGDIQVGEGGYGDDDEDKEEEERKIDGEGASSSSDNLSDVDLEEKILKELNTVGFHIPK
jgi:hypothetical protein